MMRTALILVLFLSVAGFAAGRQKAVASPHAAMTQAQPDAGVSAEQAQALRDDLNRMKSLVQQMETNLSFVDTTQSPLKHQFQLEIDMWKMMIRQMESRLRNNKTGP